MAGSDTATCGFGLGFCQKLVSKAGENDKWTNLLNENTV